jgi:hypothetical protein
LLPDDLVGRIAIELWWINQEFLSVEIIIPPWFSMLIYITWGMNNRLVGGCRSET